MKDLLISHISDIDGVSPVILLKLTKVEFDYILKEPHEMDEFVEELLKEDLNSYQNIYKTHLFAKDYENVVIDIEECGTTLFYNYLSKKHKFKKIVEDYIKHVKNLDLWLWVEKFDFMAKELGNIFDLYGRNTYIEEMYQKLKRGKKFKWNKFENKILKIEKDTVDRYLKKKDKELYKIEYDGYLIGAVFSERYRSELGNYLSSIHPELDLVVMINMSGGLSLRTEKDIDISILAQKLNGGGHKKACGAPIEEEVKESILKNIFKDCKIKEIPE